MRVLDLIAKLQQHYAKCGNVKVVACLCDYDDNPVCKAIHCSYDIINVDSYSSDENFPIVLAADKRGKSQFY